MNCKKCNSPLNEGSAFCPVCGEKVVTDTTSVIEEKKEEMINNEPVVGQPTPYVEPTPIIEPQITEAASTVNQTIPVERKNSNAPLIVVIIILSVLLLSAIGFIVIKYVIPSMEPDTPVVDPTPTPTTTQEEDTIMGNDTLGYLKLPGEWLKASVNGASDKALQYIEKKTNTGSTATGSWLVTLNVLDKTYTTSAKEAANNEANYYNTMDSDASNVQVELDKIGSYTAYKLSCQYISDKVWVITWYFEPGDGLVHVIQVEGLDLDKDYFEIPNTFSLTKIN